MVDNFALFVSQLMLLVVLWRCVVLPPEDGADEPQRRQYKRPGNAAEKIADQRAKGRRP